MNRIEHCSNTNLPEQNIAEIFHSIDNYLIKNLNYIVLKYDGYNDTHIDIYKRYREIFCDDFIDKIYQSLGKHIIKDLNYIILGYYGYNDRQIKIFKKYGKIFHDVLFKIIFSYLGKYTLKYNNEFKDMTLFARSYNLLKMMSGMQGLAFSS